MIFNKFSPNNNTHSKTLTIAFGTALGLSLALAGCNSSTSQNTKNKATAAIVIGSDTPKFDTNSGATLPQPDEKPYRLVSLDTDIPVDVVENPDIDPLTGKPLVPADQVIARQSDISKSGELKYVTSIASSAALARAAKRSKAMSFAQRSHLYDEIIKRHAKLQGIPYKLARAMIFKESAFRVNALGRAGEIGLMQVKPSTAREMGYNGTRAALYDPETNIKYGMKYLAKAKAKSDGTTCGLILKYNAGLYAKRMNKTSARYCRHVKATMAKGI